MTGVEKTITYFSEPGSENTNEVIKAVIRRVEERGIKTVVVASTSGDTGVKFAKALKGKANTVVVPEPEKMKPELRSEIVKLWGIVVDATNLPLHGRGMDRVRNAFYALGQGFKVSIEVILMATDKGAIKPYEAVVGVGGSGKDSDTAIIARSTTTKETFSGEPSKKLEVTEIIAMPLQKKWW